MVTFQTVVKSHLNKFDRVRLDLINEQPLPYGRYVFAPSHANLSLTRQCQSQCRHCAPASQPHSTETLTEDLITKYLIGLRALPIEALYVAGGEPLLQPDLVLHTFEQALRLPSIMSYVLETNLFWCDSYERIEKVLGQLASLGFENLRKTLLIAGNIDQLHSRFSPLENNLRLISVFYDYFPNGLFAFSHSYSPEDNSLETFTALLEQKKMLIKKKTAPLKGKEIVTEYIIKVGGKERQIEIDNKFPVLVGRGKELRTLKYLAWRKTLSGATLTLHDHESRLYPNRPVPEILSLGWNGLIYHDGMFMHTTTYPIGDITLDTPEEGIVRANKDPLLCRLIKRGFGAVYRVAKSVIPGLEAKYKEALSNGLMIEEFALDTLSDSEANLEIVKKIIEEEDSGSLPKMSDYHAVQNFAEAKSTLDRLVTADWTGLEHKYLSAVINLIKKLEPTEAVAAITYLKTKGETGLLTLSLLKAIADPEKNAEIMRQIVANEEMLDLFASSATHYYQEELKDFVKELLRALCLAKYDELGKLVSQSSEEKKGEAIFLTIDDMLALNLEHFVADFLAALTDQQRSILLTHIYKNDHYKGKITTSDLLRLIKQEGLDTQAIVDMINDPALKREMTILANRV